MSFKMAVAGYCQQQEYELRTAPCMLDVSEKCVSLMLDVQGQRTTYTIEGGLAIPNIEIESSIDANEDDTAPLRELNAFRPVRPRPLQL